MDGKPEKNGIELTLKELHLFLEMHPTQNKDSLVKKIGIDTLNKLMKLGYVEEQGSIFKDVKITQKGLTERDALAIKLKHPIAIKHVELFNISKFKLAVLSIATLGIYDIYFFYKNWKALRDQGGLSVSPFWRAILGILFCYSLSKEIFSRSKNLGEPSSHSAGGVAVAYFILSGMGRVDGLVWLISLFSFIPLFSIQDAIRFNNSAINPKSKPDGHFSYKELLLLLPAIIISAILLLGFVGNLNPIHPIVGTWCSKNTAQYQITFNNDGKLWGSIGDGNWTVKNPSQISAETLIEGELWKEDFSYGSDPERLSISIEPNCVRSTCFTPNCVRSTCLTLTVPEGDWKRC